MGAFDLWAWQVWWLVGLWVGVQWAHGNVRLVTWAERLAVPAAVVSASFLLLRYAEVQRLVAFGRSEWLLDKWNLGPARIVDFAAVASLPIRFRSALRRLAVAPLVLLGRASLEVFCVHLLCVFAALLALRTRPAIGGWPGVALVLGSWSAMLATAAVMARAKRSRVPGGGPRLPAAGGGHRVAWTESR
jgi:hypothetical protein